MRGRGALIVLRIESLANQMRACGDIEIGELARITEHGLPDAISAVLRSEFLAEHSPELPFECVVELQDGRPHHPYGRSDGAHRAALVFALAD